MKNIRVYISYSEQDKDYQDELLSHLRATWRRLLPYIDWHDQMILSGTRRYDVVRPLHEIQAQLRAQDIILLLISDGYLETPYCKEVEIPLALNALNSSPAPIVMPVILSHCAWKDTDLAEIQVFPEKANPVEDWMPTSAAYENIAKSAGVAFSEIIRRRGEEVGFGGVKGRVGLPLPGGNPSIMGDWGIRERRQKIKRDKHIDDLWENGGDKYVERISIWEFFE